jgi:hypothetical protein
MVLADGDTKGNSGGMNSAMIRLVFAYFKKQYFCKVTEIFLVFLNLNLWFATSTRALIVGIALFKSMLPCFPEIISLDFSEELYSNANQLDNETMALISKLKGIICGLDTKSQTRIDGNAINSIKWENQTHISVNNTHIFYKAGNFPNLKYLEIFNEICVQIRLCPSFKFPSLYPNWQYLVLIIIYL